MATIARAPLGLLAICVLPACGEDRAVRVGSRSAADLATLGRMWNEGEIVGFIAHVDATKYLEDREQATQSMERMRRELGAIVHRADPIVDGKPEDRQAYAIVHQVTATAVGVARFSLVYDRNLRIIGFNVEGVPSQAAPR